MNKLHVVTTLSAVLLASPLTGQNSDSAEVQLKTATHLELVDGDLKAAIEKYKKIITNTSGSRSVAAKALLQMGQCDEKLGIADARRAYERVVRDFADQREIAAQARVRLAALEPGTSGNHGPVMASRRVWSGADLDTNGAVSADGRYLTYQDQETGDLAIRNLQTGEKRRLTNTSPPWDEFAEMTFPSADGRFVAYEWYNKDDSFDLRVISVSGENSTAGPRILYRNKEVGHIHPAGWSQDSKSILAYLFRRDGTHQIALIEARDGSAKVLKSFDWRSTNQLKLSPDGRDLAYDFPPNEDSPEHDIYLLATDGSHEVRVVEHPGDDLLLGWVPDGQAILFASDRTGTTAIWKLPVAAGKPNGLPELVKGDIGRIIPLGFSATGAFYYGIGTGIRDVYITPIDPKSLEPLATPMLATQRFLGTNQGADWSADGKYFAYASRRGQVWDSPSLICIRSVETGAEREIMPQLASIGSYNGIRWARDGRHIFVVGSDRKGHLGIYKVNAQTGETNPVVYVHPNGAISGPICSPDGKTLYYSRETGRTMALNLETESEREVFRKPGGALSPVAISPDGTRLAFVDNENPRSEHRVLMVIPSEGGEPRVLVRAPQIAGRIAPIWTPDGEQILFAKRSQDKLELWRISEETRQQQFVDVFPRFPGALRISPDGRQLAYTAGDVKTEVWVLENFLHGLTAKK